MFWILSLVFVAINCYGVNTQFDFEVKFNNGQAPGKHYGTVEIYYNRNWWLIASANWTLSNSLVVCKSLGYSDVHAYAPVNRVDNSRMLTARSFICTGKESGLQYCKQFDFPSSAFDNIGEKIVKITCKGLEESHVRLVGGLTAKEGRAEVYHNGEWGTICNSGMVLSDATALCRTVGYDTKLANYGLSRRLRKATGRIWIDNLRCDGSESKINECSQVSWNGSDSCNHNDDVYMYCYSDNDIRLQSNNVHSGIVEFYHSEVWGYTCESNYYYSSYSTYVHVDATVACRSLGFTNPIVGEYTTRNSTSKIWLDYISCDGHENSLIECEHDDWTGSSCSNVWVVVCMQSVVNETDEQKSYICRKKCLNGHCRYGDDCICYGSWYGDWCEYSDYTYPDDDDDNKKVGLIVGLVSGSILVIVFVVLLSVYRCPRKNRTDQPVVAYSANQVNLIPVVQIGPPGSHMPIIQPFSQAPGAVAGAQAMMVQDSNEKVPLDGSGVQPDEPPPYNA
ncbi:CD5 antigen-like [Antedon mediterranea]|uniref:CD5 antigen-like n=1 Tax=Antedon mediterranea TaxID=105859 RepID=UPI003AF971AE